MDRDIDPLPTSWADRLRDEAGISGPNSLLGLLIVIILIIVIIRLL